LLYLILAMMLSFMAVSGMLSEQALRRIGLQRERPARLFATVPGTFGVRLTNGKRRLSSYALHLAEPDLAGGPTPRCFFLKVGPQERRTWRYSLTFPRRGWQRLPGLRLSTRFPFGLFTKSSRPLQTDPVLVYPAVRPLGAGEIPPALERNWRERHRRGRGAGLYNLRPYRPGDDPRLLHWKTTARTGELVLREREEEERARIRLILEDPLPGAAAEAVEADLAYAASVAAHAIRIGALVELVTADGILEAGAGEEHLERILERLAVYATPATPRSLHLPAGSTREVRVRLGAQNRGEAGA
jgi:uncharacterized protein (DUF58 family)